MKDDKIKIIGKIIDEWDPIELFPFSPEDEYIREIELVVELRERTEDLIELAKGIQAIFLSRFGKITFNSQKSSQSILIAEKY